MKTANFTLGTTPSAVRIGLLALALTWTLVIPGATPAAAADVQALESTAWIGSTQSGADDGFRNERRSRFRNLNRRPATTAPAIPNRPLEPIAPVPSRPAAPKEEEQPLSEAEKLQLRITQRYQDPQITRFLQTLTPQRAAAMYQEVSRMIDTRHMQPASYQVRVRQAIANLNAALDNRAFRDANRLTASATQIGNFRRALSDLESRQPATTISAAANAMQQAMNLAQQHLGLNANVVALEFVYGAAEAHDAYSTYLPPDRASGPSASLNDHVVGIGVEIKAHDKGLEIAKVLANGPAHDARLQAGDLILAVDGRNLAGLSLSQAADLIAGPSGSRIVLTVNRADYTGTVTMTRRSVRVTSVSDVRMIDPSAKVGYIKLERFANSSSEEMDEALWSLHRQGMESLVLDLRGNPGGLLTSALQIANKFLPRGTIVSTRGRTAADNTHEAATFEQTWRVPLVVLIDKDSASASEILAAAVQDNNRGVVVGRQSFGKGTVQTQFGLQSVAGSLRLTTAKFYAPSGREIAGNGVVPDLRIDEHMVGFNSIAGLDRDTQAALGVASSPLLKELAAKVAAPARQNAVQPHGNSNWLMVGSN